MVDCIIQYFIKVFDVHVIWDFIYATSLSTSIRLVSFFNTLYILWIYALKKNQTYFPKVVEDRTLHECWTPAIASPFIIINPWFLILYHLFVPYEYHNFPFSGPLDYRAKHQWYFLLYSSLNEVCPFRHLEHEHTTQFHSFAWISVLYKKWVSMNSSTNPKEWN